MQCVQPCHSIGIWCSTATQDRSCAHVKVHGKSDASMPGPSGMRLLQTLSSTSLHCIPSDVLLTCVETDPPVLEPQFPSACIASQLLPQKLTISTRLISELCQRQNVFFADWPKPLRSRLVAYADSSIIYCSETMASPSPGHSSPPWQKIPCKIPS